MIAEDYDDTRNLIKLLFDVFSFFIVLIR